MVEEKKDDGEKKVAVPKVRPIRNWREFLSLWESTVIFEQKIGLLHVGFNLSLEHWTGEKEYDEIDRLIFYFINADSWTDYDLLRLPEDSGESFHIRVNGHSFGKMTCELRQQLAHKAFDMLCVNFFREIKLEKESGKFNREWEEIIISERLFPVIQNFFRAEEARIGRDIVVRNLSRWNDKRSNNERQAVNFLLNLARFIWEWEERNTYFMPEPQKSGVEEYDAKVRAKIEAAKPWMIEILSELNRLGALIEYILKLDERCLAKLKEIALRAELCGVLVAKSRPVTTIEESLYTGSKAALFLKRYEMTMWEYNRLKRIRDAEQQIEEAGRTIQKLKK